MTLPRLVWSHAPRALGMLPLFFVACVACADEPRQADEPSKEEQLALRSAGLDEPGKLLDYLRKLGPVEISAEDIRRWIEVLASPKFQDREEAQRKLIAAGHPALKALRSIESADPDLRRRIKTCIQTIEDGSPEQRFLTWAATRAVMRLKPEGAEAALLAALPTLEIDPNLGDQVWSFLYDLAASKGTVSAVYVEAARDWHPARRALAALVLGRRGNDEQRQVARRLLEDKDPSVRLRAAQGLLAAGDKRAIPVLIELLNANEPVVVLQAEELLHWVAGDQAPDESPAIFLPKDAWRRLAWQAWWRQAEAKLDLAAVAREPRRPGLFMWGKQELRGAGQHLFGWNGRWHWSARDFGAQAVWDLASDGRLLAVGLPRDMWPPPYGAGTTRNYGRQFIVQMDLNGRVDWRHEQHEDRTVLSVRRRSDGRVQFATEAGEGMLSAGGLVIKDPWLEPGIKHINRNLLKLPDHDVERIRLPNGHVLDFELWRGRLIETNKQGRLVGEYPCLLPDKAWVRIVLPRLRLGFDDLPGRDYDLAKSLPHRLAQLRSRDPALRYLAVRAIQLDFDRKVTEAIPLLFQALGDCFATPSHQRHSKLNQQLREAIKETSTDLIRDAMRLAESDNDRVRAAAVAIVGLFESKKEREPERWSVVRTAVRDPSPLVRRMGLASTMSFRERAEEVVPLLTEALEDEAVPVGGDSCVGATAASSLIVFKAHARSAVPALKKATRGADGSRADSAAQALAGVAMSDPAGFPDAYRWFVATLKDPTAHPSVRSMAAHCVAKLGTDTSEVVTELIGFLSSEETVPVRVKLAVIGELRLLKGAARPAIGVLKAALEDPDSHVRRQAELALREIGAQ